MISSIPPGKPLNPLGMPAGSVRAILALTIVAAVLIRVLSGGEVGLLLSETLMIVLAHYFAARRTVTVSAAVPQAEAEAHPEANPLWLPRGSVRLLILGAFGMAAVILLLQGRLFDPTAIGTIGLVFAYLGGILVRWLRGGRNHEPRPPKFRLWPHLQAFLVLMACGLAVLMSLGGDLPGWFEKGMLAFILFYFGTR